jgi:Domain of unknown function (DUF1707)
MGEPGELRISDADREAAAQRLHTAMGEGRITLAELEERLDVVYAAKTYADLRPPLADLPGGAEVVPTVAAAPAERAEPVHLRTDLGSVKRSGDWQVPPTLRLTTSLGSIHLDLTEVRSIPHRIDVEVSVGAGEVVIVLPAGATANVDGVHGSWGEITSKVGSVPGTGPHLTITGKAGMGSLTVRGPRTGWKAMFGT